MMAALPGEAIERRCPRCGEDFRCGKYQPATDPCWCASLGIDPDALKRLAATFDGCLCTNCLRAESEGASRR